VLKRLIAWIFCIILVGAVVVALLPGPSELPNELASITWYTEEYPPYNYEKDGVPEGIAVETLREVLAELGIDPAEADIRIGSWSEGYQTVLHTPMTVVFSTARTPERENLFKWAGPVFNSKNVLFALKDRNVTIFSLQDLTQIRIGIIRDDVAGADLISFGVAPENLVVSTNAQEIVSLLESGRIDAWAYAELPGEEIIKAIANDPERFGVVYSLKTWDYYFAFNRDVPDAIVNEFQAGIDHLKRERDSLK